MTSTYVVGITGGIGSGKSTVCKLFGEFDIPTVDTDHVSREVVAPNSDGLGQLVAAFGDGILSEDGAMDRAKVREIVFGDDDALKRLEGIVHPLIRLRTAEHLAAITAPYCLLAVPLLTEKGRYETMQRILVVDVATEIQVARVMARDELTEAQVKAIMAKQATRDQRLAIADDVIENNGSIDDMRDAVARLHQQYLSFASS